MLPLALRSPNRPLHLPAFESNPLCVSLARALQLIRLVVEGRRPTLPSDGSVPAGVAMLIQRCWAQDPRARPSFLDCVAELERLA